MQDWQVRLMLEAQAVMVRVEGMKADNAQRAFVGNSPAYTGADFEQCASEIEGYAHGIGQG